MVNEALATAARRLRAVRRTQTALPALIYMTDDVRTPDPVPVATRLPRGAAVILRHYQHPGREDLARALMKVARARGLLVLIGADPGLAYRVRAAGVHWPEALVHPRLRQPGWIVTAAAPSLPALVKARRAGVDAALVSPVFATGSGAAKMPLGVLRFAGLAAVAPLPVYALGGIDVRNARRLRHTGASGFAGIAGFEG